MNIFFLFCTLLGSTFSDYFDLVETYPETLGPNGDYKQHEIEIVLDEEEIISIEDICEARLLDKGVSPAKAFDWSRVGIISEDQYLYWIRDAVRFPSNTVGTYDRVLWKSALLDAASVGILAKLPNGKVIVNLNYRHATRSWEIELPRGARQHDESPTISAKRRASARNRR